MSTTTKATKKYIIDEHCTLKSGTLVEDNGCVYSCTLNQTDIGENKNKFYIMQLIHDNDKYHLFIRYGRIGDVGTKSLKLCGSKNDGMMAFQKQFRTKTNNTWSSKLNIDNFVKKDGKYFLSQISYEDELKDIDDTTTGSVVGSKLDKKVQELIKMISDINMMNNTLVQLDIDTKKMPLGKINQTQLDKAKELLIQMEAIITKIKNIDPKNTTELATLNDNIVKLSSQYYTYIPNACGRRKPPIINNNEILTKYKDTIDDLSNIVVGVNIINNVKKDENPIDAVYKDIGTKIEPLDNSSILYKEIDNYIKNTHGPTHGCKLKLLDVYTIGQDGKEQKFNNYSKKIGNKMLLFHGTPQSCVLSIMKRDFYLDPTKLADAKQLGVQIAGKMFGYGVYFSDCASKSANYCRAYQTNNIGCMFLAEVAMGNICEKLQADSYINKASLEKAGYQSVQGMGKWSPSGTTTVNGVQIPNKPIITKNINTSLRYNEFIVYDINQLVIKYLVIVQNIGDYSGW
ncbi:MAG: polyADP-ribose polymerase [Homavirus sp.]|uniref:NAD(+) ADP-ribosyltransferase n=1 Tax=Homavirus sp. TaxID=2487769 RepID=A0A3G5A4B9_9VIRU|nr:MAG: polyADP-ribose polymerase [Homavirus sp.]